jgi:hypothetical protein
MPASVVREELETLGIHVQGALQLRSGRRDQDVARDRPLTPHFIVSVARGAEDQKVRSLTEFCSSRVRWSRMLHRRLTCSVSLASGSATLSATVGIHPVALPVARHTFLGKAQPPNSSLNVAAVGVTTQPIIGAA